MWLSVKITIVLFMILDTREHKKKVLFEQRDEIDDFLKQFRVN